MTQAAPFLFYSSPPPAAAERNRTIALARPGQVHPAGRPLPRGRRPVAVVAQADVIKVPHVGVGPDGRTVVGARARAVSHVTRSDHLCRDPIGQKLRESHNGRFSVKNSVHPSVSICFSRRALCIVRSMPNSPKPSPTTLERAKFNKRTFAHLRSSCVSFLGNLMLVVMYDNR